MAGIDEHDEGRAEVRSRIQVSEVSLGFDDWMEVAAGNTAGGGSYAAFLSSARLASWRKISVVPNKRSSAVFHSWKNTTFMSGRTRAAWPCWRMKNTSRSGCANLLSRNVITAPFGPASTFSTLALRQ